MNEQLQTILSTIQQNENLGADEKALLLKALKKVDSDLTILEFKLDRTEKVKRTTAILLEETIEELEQKRKAIEETNAALTQSLEDLKAAQAQLIQSEKMASLGELTAGIAHEIQNPLNFVNNFSEVSNELIDEMKEELAAGNTTFALEIADDLKENLSKINIHGKRADAIVKGMLEHSRSHKGEKVPTDLNALAGEFLRLSYHGLRAKDKSFNSDFLLDLDPNLPNVDVVASDIGRVILNLVNNAFYAVDEKSKTSPTNPNYTPTVSVSSKYSLLEGGEGGVVELSIQDNGSGIPEHIKEKIFQPFFTTKPTGSGTGLGLSLSYDIVKAHGGEILIESQVGVGTEFKIRLPKE
jgi:two-component system, NtrC family, sensor kinase